MNFHEAEARTTTKQQEERRKGNWHGAINMKETIRARYEEVQF